MIKNNKGLITLEACLIVILCVAAGLAMYGYLKRAIQGNWKTNIDSFSDDQYDKDRSTLSYDKQQGGPALVFSNSHIRAEIDGVGTKDYTVSSMADKKINPWGE